MQPASVGPLMRPDAASADESTRKEKIPEGISLSSTILPPLPPGRAGKFDDPPQPAFSREPRADYLFNIPPRSVGRFPRVHVSAERGSA